MTNRQYTAAQKATAVAQAMVTSQKEAAELLGIPRRTLGDWIHDPAYAGLVETTRDQLAEPFLIGIQVAVKAVVEGLDGPKVPLRDKAIALGVLFDKYALLTGSATSRTETRDLTGTLSDDDLRDAIRAADAIASGGGTAAPSEDAPEG